MVTQFQTFDEVRATYQPVRTDDLLLGMERWIGHEDIWQCNGMADPEGEYAGQASFQVATRVQNERHRAGVPFEEVAPPCCWIPECDLEILEAV